MKSEGSAGSASDFNERVGLILTQYTCNAPINFERLVRETPNSVTEIDVTSLEKIF
ncbi:hypothetical protein Lmac_1727 [Legionella maceachernii]|uniref:Uncharacterized protein n=1 Tax=Legionella maceachernii TaxID=466 RepID=A0A0W0W0A8_9GAMM|nr:hypothetical protein Lmac_1727 [Legionella maceachernii]SJZ49323.1 hypothetical protein SAMN02745128_00234 [Legionella maceachernii]SUP03799.1 Uncharacterised protein [Legionella maceachernii]